MARVQIDSVVKRFGEVEVLKGVDLEIQDGEMLVILGASGCGKTTLLRLIAGLETVSEGQIRIGERLVNDVEPKDRDIAMVFQNYALYPHMKVFDNMAYGLRNRGMARDEIERRVREAAALLSLDALLDRRPRQLSGGQRQRVAMGRAIVREPAVFLFDEPLSNLDAALRAQMRVEIRELQKRLQTTGVFVTHDQVEAMTMADRIMLMHEGRVEQVDAPMELYRRPRTTYAATFIGAPAMNLITGRIDATGTRFERPGFAMRLAEPRPGAAGRQVILGVRPEHLRPALASESEAVTLPVRLVERLGADQVVHGHIEDHGTVLVRLPGSLEVGYDAPLRLSVEAEAVHLFDPETGQRLADDVSRAAA